MTPVQPRRTTRFTITLTAPAGPQGIHALRALLKIARRRLGLIAVEAREEPVPAPDVSNQIADAFAGLRRDVRSRLRGRS
jgi:hypothetical protein